MPRVMVITDEHADRGNGAVLLDEQVSSIHLDSEHSAWQFIERLGWAISDAEDSEHGRRVHAHAAIERSGRGRARRRGARGGAAPRELVSPRV